MEAPFNNSMAEVERLPPAPDSIRGFSAFLWVILLVPVLFFVMPFLILKLPGYERWSISPIGKAIEHGFITPNIDADIVIVGDSSALYGIDPRQMSADLGVKVINLANTLESLPVTGKMELEQYLKVNRRPRLIIFYLAPWNLDYNHVDLSLLYDGEEMMIRHGTAGEVFHFFVSHPLALLQFPFEFYASNSLMNANRRHLHPVDPADIVGHLGHAENLATQHLVDGCRLLERFANVGPVTDSAQSLLEQFRTSASQDMVYVAPLPGCSNISIVMSLPYAQVQAAPPRVLPPASFADDNYYAHLLKPAVPEATHQLEVAIRPTLAKSATR